jgi:hypothetical protein
LKFSGTKRGQSVDETRPISFLLPSEPIGLDFSSSPPTSSQFFVRHVEIALRLLNARVPEHELNDPNVDAVREQPARAFVAQVVPPHTR